MARRNIRYHYGLVQLTYEPLALVVFSGGKSLHAWWPCANQNDKNRGTSLRRHLKGAGFCSIKLPDREDLSELDNELNRRQRECNVHYAGPLAGYSIGLYEEGDKQFLVTSQRRPIEPKEGDWPILGRLCENLFADPQHEDKRPYVFGWLKIALESLASGHRRPGQPWSWQGICWKVLIINWSQFSDLNRGPTVYKSVHAHSRKEAQKLGKTAKTHKIKPLANGSYTNIETAKCKQMQSLADE